MSSKTPYLTLAGAAGLFATLLIVNMVNSSGEQSSEYGSGAPDTSATTTAPTETTEPTEPTEPTDTKATDEPSAPELPERAVFAGHTQRGSGPALAIAVLHSKAAAYFCDGVSAESWLSGETDGTTLTLAGPGKDAVTGRLAHRKLVGHVTVDGRTYRFSLAKAKPPAGLYRAQTRGGTTTIGWIILPDGSQVGVQNDGGSTEPAPQLTPGSAVSVAGNEIVAHKVAGDAEFGSDR